MMIYETDYFAIIFAMAMIIIGTVSIVRSPDKINSRNSKKLIAGGISLIIILTILDSFIEHHSDFDYIISFICLKKVNVTHTGEYLRYLVSISYIFIILGSLQLLLASSNESEKSNEANVINDSHSKNVLNEKEYINARFQSLILQKAMVITIVLIAPLGLISFLIRLIYIHNAPMWIIKIQLIIICLGTGGAFFSFILFKKYWVFKIITNKNEIRFFGFLKKINANWNQVISMEIRSTGILFGGAMIAVKTRNGEFYFPRTMKIKDDLYPKLDLLGENWVTSDGSKMPVSVENCMLYNEIKKQVKF